MINTHTHTISTPASLVNHKHWVNKNSASSLIGCITTWLKVDQTDNSTGKGHKNVRKKTAEFYTTPHPSAHKNLHIESKKQPLHSLTTNCQTNIHTACYMQNNLWYSVIHWECLQCFDTVGWVAGRASSLFSAGMVICLKRGADLHQLIPLPLTVSCFSKIQIGFTFLVPAHLGSPGKRAVKRVALYTGNNRS